MCALAVAKNVPVRERESVGAIDNLKYVHHFEFTNSLFDAVPLQMFPCLYSCHLCIETIGHLVKSMHLQYITAVAVDLAGAVFDGT